MVFWNLFTGLQSTVYSVHHCKIQINKFAKTRKFDPLQRLVAALCLTGRVGEYVEDTIVKFLDIADVSQIGKQNTQQLIRRTKRVCKDSLSVTAGYDEGTDTQWRISH